MTRDVLKLQSNITELTLETNDSGNHLTHSMFANHLVSWRFSTVVINIQV